ncbi:MAG: protein kinase [Polyangiaceae bacterium]|nr:protein kinase [Polyangiaceae bacterium]
MIQAGKVLNGRYKLLRPLGQGSQAYVWVAEHLALGSQVAVKLIDPELAKQEDARERFAREATAAAKLRSQHVVQMLDHGIEGDQPFIVMELLDGEDLFDRLEHRQRLTLAETSKIVTQVARALMRAHAEGIIHRDLKPENVFLVRNEDEELAKVLDFGVAKVTTPAKAAMTRTGVGTLIGTPHYMSPEQVKGVSEIDHRSDLWSLGVITYQCVTGHLPFDSEGVGDLLIRITQNTPAVPSTLNPEMPAAFDDWFRRACAKEPTERFQTAREMADALAKAVGIQAALSQSGRMLVNLGDSPDLDWGSLAGVRIPVPAMGLPPVTDGPPSSRGIAAAAVAMRSREETLDGNDFIEVVEGSKPPPPPEASPPPSSAAPASPSQPRPPARPVPTPPSLAANPFLADVPPASRPGPISSSGVSMPRSPSSGRGLQSTVTGLSSPSDAPIDAPPELDGSRRRRAGWFVGFALIATAGAVTFGVVQSRGGFKSASPSDPASAPTTTSRPTTAASQPATATTTTSEPAGVAASSSSSAEAIDPFVTKKPSPSASASVAPPGSRPRRPNDAIEIEIPDPDREIRLPRGQ